MELGASNYLVNGGGGVDYFESEFQNRKSSDFQQYDPRPLFKIKYDPHTLSQNKSMTPRAPVSYLWI